MIIVIGLDGAVNFLRSWDCGGTPGNYGLQYVHGLFTATLSVYLRVWVSRGRISRAFRKQTVPP